MSDVVILYDSKNVFEDIGPTPFISRDVQNIYSSSEKHIVDSLTLTGQAKRGYNFLVGMTGVSGPVGVLTPSWTNCGNGFEGTKNVADALVSKFSKNFKKLQLIESVGQTVQGIQGIQGIQSIVPFRIVEEWDSCIVRSISFDDNKWYDWIPYTIQLDCYRKGYFDTYGIIEPKRSVDLEVSPDNTVNVKLSCSCKGVNKNEGGFQNAKNFVAANSELLSSDLNNFYLTSASSVSTSNKLLAESAFDNGTYWVKQNITVSADEILAPDETQTADKITCSTNVLNLIRGGTLNPGSSSSMPPGKYKASIHVKAGTAEWVTLSVGFEKIRVSGATGNGTTATITYPSGSGIVPVGTTVTIENINPSGYNGTFVVTASTTTSLSYASIVTSAYISGGTINYQGLNPYLIRGWFNIQTGKKGSIYLDDTQSKIYTDTTKYDQNNKYSYINHYVSDLGNGWYKISITYEAFTFALPFFRLSLVDSNGVSNYSTIASKYLYIWKAAIEDYYNLPDLNSYNTFLVSQDESLNRLTGEVSLNKSFILQSSLSKSTYGILKYSKDMTTSEKGEVTVKINGTHQGPLLAEGLDQVTGSDSTLEAIKYDISNKDWYSKANELYLTDSKQFKYPNFSSRISQRLAGLTGTTEQKRIWSTFSPSTLTFVKNPACWIYGIDISGFVVASSEPGYESRKVGMLITPKHYLFSYHYPVNVGQTLYFLTNDNKVLTRTLVSTIEVEGLHMQSDLGLGVLNEDLPDTVKFFRVLAKNYKNFTNLEGYSLFVRDQRDTADDPNPYQKAGVGKFEYTVVDLLLSITTLHSVYDTINQFIQSATSPESLFFTGFDTSDSGSNVCLITPNDEMIALGLIDTIEGDFDMIPPYIDNINKALSELGSDYSVTEYYPEDFSPLYTTPTNFSLQRNFSTNSVSFSLDFSNKQDNKIYLIDDTSITHDLVTSRKCIESSLNIKSEIKCKKERWDTIVKYYNSLDFINYIQSKWTKYGNTERLNFNEKDNTYSENQFDGSIQISAKFCNSLGSDCGCLQDFKYEYSFTPPLKEIKASLPIDSNGCHYIEDLRLLKRANFSIKGSLIKPTCCSTEKTVAQLRNRVNQISNSVFYGTDKILTSAQISKTSPAGAISFDFSWSATKDAIIPDNLL
jgi:hypothetical protein